MRTGQKIRCVEVVQLADAKRKVKGKFPLPDHDTLYTADEFTMCQDCCCFSVSIVELDGNHYPFHWFEPAVLS